jgi:hypothetical protein
MIHAAPQTMGPGTSMTSLTRLLAVGQLALVAATWKLWTPQSVFPQVPLIRAACDWPGWFDWVCLAVLVGSSVAMLVVARRGRAGRMASAALAVSLAGFFVLDQHRLQPWAWQFFLLAILLSLADDATTRRGWMGLVISIYFWSAVSKFDYTFFHVQGPALLGGLKQAMGMRGMPNRWTEMLDIAGSVGLALGEMGVAVMLAWPRTRWLGLWTATIMHVALLAALGPLGLNHSSGVLLWNVFFIVQDWLLFRGNVSLSSPDDGGVLVQWGRWLRPLVTWPGPRSNRLALGVIAAAMALPVLESFGYCDHWLAWAVYSARSDSVSCNTAIPDFDSDDTNWPTTLRPEVIQCMSRFELTRPPEPGISFGNWSLNELDAPIYPQARFQVGVALALYVRGDVKWDDLVIWTARERWTRPKWSRRFRFRRTGQGVESVVDSYLWNARPRMTTFGAKPKSSSP